MSSNDFSSLPPPNVSAEQILRRNFSQRDSQPIHPEDGAVHQLAAENIQGQSQSIGTKEERNTAREMGLKQLTKLIPMERWW